MALQIDITHRNLEFYLDSEFKKRGLEALRELVVVGEECDTANPGVMFRLFPEGSYPLTELKVRSSQDVEDAREYFEILDRYFHSAKEHAAKFGFEKVSRVERMDRYDEIVKPISSGYSNLGIGAPTIDSEEKVKSFIEMVSEIKNGNGALLRNYVAFLHAEDKKKGSSQTKLPPAYRALLIQQAGLTIDEVHSSL